MPFRTSGKTEFQKVRNPRGEVEIYSAEEVQTLLLNAVESDVALIPAIVVSCFQGLRPDEFHAENAKRRPLTWEAFNWGDQQLPVAGQKVRSKANRDILLHPVTQKHGWSRSKASQAKCGAIRGPLTAE
jgi:hypothetical protein